MEKQFEKKPSVTNALKGAFIGMANMIPGVSGGTIAVITGIYDELVDALGNFFSGSSGWRRNTLFLIPVLAGIIAGAIGFARLITFFLEAYPEQTMFFFIGLILGSGPYLVRRAGAEGVRLRYVVPFVAALILVLAIGLAESPDATEPVRQLTLQSGVWVFVGAFVAAIAMIVPGLSGSFLMLLIGMYSTLTAGFSELNVPIMALFVVGTLAGVVSVSKIIAWLLRRFHGPTYFGILGLVLGSVISLWPGPVGGTALVVSIAAAAVGFAISMTFGTGMKERVLGREEKAG